NNDNNNNNNNNNINNKNEEEIESDLEMKESIVDDSGNGMVQKYEEMDIYYDNERYSDMEIMEDESSVIEGTNNKPLNNDDSGDELDEDMTDLELISLELSRMKAKHYGYRQLVEHLKNDRVHLWEQIEELTEINSQLAYNIQDMTEQTRDVNLLKQELLSKDEELHEQQTRIENHDKEMDELSMQLKEQKHQHVTLENKVKDMHNDIHSYADDVKCYYGYVLSVLMDLYENSSRVFHSPSSSLPQRRDDHTAIAALASTSGTKPQGSSLNWMLQYVEQSHTFPLFDCAHHEVVKAPHSTTTTANPSTSSRQLRTRRNNDYALPGIIFQLRHLLQAMLREIMSARHGHTKSMEPSPHNDQKYTQTNGNIDLNQVLYIHIHICIYTIIYK
ncbi:viral A-type inclusion protein, partial [Reticulomyxa filosa]